MTGFNAATRATIIEREGGRCARCGDTILAGGHIHHRQPRGMGGTSNPAVNGVANGLHLCADCHRTIESERQWSRVFGYLLPANPGVLDPAAVPVFYRGIWMLLGADGTLNPTEGP